MNHRTCNTLRNTVLPLLLLAVVALPSLAQNTRVLLLNPPGSIYTAPSGLNNLGVTVGAFELAGQNLEGFIYQPTTNEYTAIQYPGAVSTTALGVNDAGTVAGTFANQDGVNHGFFLENGAYRQYDVPGFSGTSIIGINKAGDFAGTVGSNGFYQGYLSVGGVVTTFTVNGGATNAYGINSSNVSVGFFVNSAGTEFHGFMRDGSGQITQIDYPGSLSSACTGINDAGVITGFYEDRNNVDHGFVLVKGKFQKLAAPYVADINNHNVIVGSVTGKTNTYGFMAAR